MYKTPMDEHIHEFCSSRISGVETPPFVCIPMYMQCFIVNMHMYIVVVHADWRLLKSNIQYCSTCTLE